MVVTDLNQSPGVLNFVFAVEERDLNQRIFGRHLGRKEPSKCDLLFPRESVYMKSPVVKRT